MKGSLHTDELLGAVVARETGLRTGRRISHVFVMDVPTYHKVLIVTDAAINIAPTLEDKVDICQNAIDLVVSLGVKKPKVAILAAVETVNSKMPATIDAAALCKMADRRQITGGMLDGPLAFDNAISKEAAKIKGIESEVAGDPDILLVPGPRGGEHARQAADFSGQRRQRGSGARRTGADHPDEPRRQRAIADRELRGGGAGGARAASIVAERLVGERSHSDERLCGRAQRRFIEPQVLRLPEAGERGVAARSARSDRRHRHVAAILRRRMAPANGWPTRRSTSRRCATGATALDALAGWLRSTYGGARVLGVGHRVVHGGPRFTGPTIVTPQVLDELRTLVPLAPLHQPHNLAAIDAVTERLPGVPQVACFDTSFHRGQPAVAEVVPLPRDICAAGVQRYGFHGLSYEYIASVLPDVAPDIAHGRVIVAHLGSGASLCAMKDRKSIDSTLGFTALDGLCMGTRPGALDPGVVLYLFQSLGLTAKEVETILYKKSGLLGISGTSNDMRDLLASSEPPARLAVDYFVYRAAKEIGALAAVLGGIDALVFTAGIGENSPEIRQPDLRRLGVARHRPGPGREPRTAPADLTIGKPRVGVGDPDQRGTDHRAPHRRVAGPRRERQPARL